jgi:hypothetical protein
MPFLVMDDLVINTDHISHFTLDRKGYTIVMSNGSVFKPLLKKSQLTFALWVEESCPFWKSSKDTEEEEHNSKGAEETIKEESDDLKEEQVSRSDSSSDSDL